MPDSVSGIQCQRETAISQAFVLLEGNNEKEADSKVKRVWSEFIRKWHFRPTSPPRIMSEASISAMIGTDSPRSSSFCPQAASNDEGIVKKLFEYIREPEIEIPLDCIRIYMEKISLAAAKDFLRKRFGSAVFDHVWQKYGYDEDWNFYSGSSSYVLQESDEEVEISLPEESPLHEGMISGKYFHCLAIGCFANMTQESLHHLYPKMSLDSADPFLVFLAKAHQILFPIVEVSKGLNSVLFRDLEFLKYQQTLIKNPSISRDQHIIGPLSKLLFSSKGFQKLFPDGLLCILPRDSRGKMEINKAYDISIGEMRAFALFSSLNSSTSRVFIDIVFEEGEVNYIFPNTLLPSILEKIKKILDLLPEEGANVFFNFIGLKSGLLPLVALVEHIISQCPEGIIKNSENRSFQIKNICIKAFEWALLPEELAEKLWEAISKSEGICFNFSHYYEIQKIEGDTPLLSWGETEIRPFCFYPGKESLSQLFITCYEWHEGAQTSEKREGIQNFASYDGFDRKIKPSEIFTNSVMVSQLSDKHRIKYECGWNGIQGRLEKLFDQAQAVFVERE